MADVTYGDWTAHGPYLQVGDLTTDEANTLIATGYAGNTGVLVRHQVRASSYGMTQSFDAASHGYEPWDALGDRLCALRHAADEASGGWNFWSPGQCPTVTPVLLSGNSGGLPVGESWEVGTAAGIAPGGLPLVGDAYTVTAVTSAVTVVLDDGGGTFDPDPAGPDWLYHSVPWAVLMQVPGWYDYVSTHAPSAPQPQVYPTSVVVTDVGLTVPGPQALDQPVTARGYRMDSLPITVTGPKVPATSAISGSGDFTVSCVEGASSGGVDLGELVDARGVNHVWAITSDRAQDAMDPGVPAIGGGLSSLGHGAVRYTATWQVMARFPLSPVLNVLRWRQRDDGYGLTGAMRGRTGTSLQRGFRHRTYRMREDRP